MNINSDKARELTPEELDMVSGGVNRGNFDGSFIGRLFSKSDISKENDNKPKPVNSNGPLVNKA